jgi:hypothetical protein
MTQITTNTDADKEEIAAATIENVAAQKAKDSPAKMFKGLGALAGALAGLPISQTFQGDMTWLSVYPMMDYLESIFTQAPHMISSGTFTPVILTVAALAVVGFCVGGFLAEKMK